MDKMNRFYAATFSIPDVAYKYSIITVHTIDDLRGRASGGGVNLLESYPKSRGALSS